MHEVHHFLAFDFGATSGRAIVGCVTDGALTLDEVHRFPNRIVREATGHLRWDIFSLYDEMLSGLKKAQAKYPHIDSIGIDTWGVDVAFVDRRGDVISMPYSYRDPHTEGAPERFFSQVMSAEELYSRTGIQVMNFNTLFQLDTLRRNGAPELEAADKILFMPDALRYMLTGRMFTEYTIASTSHFLDPRRKCLDGELLKAIGISPDMFPPMVMPGTVAGDYQGIPVIAVAGHDTASAVAAVPSEGGNYAYLSSGTWSLLGVVTDDPVLTPEAAAANITNEGGLGGTVRFLKNITGMWIVENLLSEWRAKGVSIQPKDFAKVASGVADPGVRINPDDPGFAAPSSMSAAMEANLAARGLTMPSSEAAVLRMVFESLAQRYGEVLKQICTISGKKVDTLHIIGGGSKNTLLNEFTARATGCTVVAGPSEATAIGNIKVQAMAAGVRISEY